MYSPAELQEFRCGLQTWYGQHQRLLPWRQTHDPYRIWLSEIMLQQTTVAAVVPYFERFLTAFPDVQALAAADESAVLRQWEGLGYYSRARNIHKTAQKLVADYNGQFPQAVEELLKLPGIGRYTAGAIASFAFDLPAPIVEANTQRLYARLLAWDQELSRSASQKALWGLAAELIPDQNPGLFNQALMDLGSQICKPVEPDCEQCPVQRVCRACQQHRQQEIPVQKSKQPPTPVTHVCVAVQRKGKYLLQQYQVGQRWAGLWDFPRWESQTFPVEKLTSKAEGLRTPQLFDDRDLHRSLFELVEQEFEQNFKQPVLDRTASGYDQARSNPLCDYPRLLRSPVSRFCYQQRTKSTPVDCPPGIASVPAFNHRQTGGQPAHQVMRICLPGKNKGSL